MIPQHEPMSKGIHKGMMSSHETQEKNEVRIAKKNKPEHHRGAPQNKAPDAAELDLID